VKIVDSNPSLDLSLRSEPEDESSSVIQKRRYTIGQVYQNMTDLNLNLNELKLSDGQFEALLEASRRECCKLESENQALQGAVERHKEEKKQLAIDYERKLRDKDNEISKLMTRNKRSLPTIREIPANSAAMQNPRTSLKIGDKEKKTPRQEDNGGVGEEGRTRLRNAATSVMVTSLSSRRGVAGVSLVSSSYLPPGGHQRGVITELSHGQRHSDRSRATPSVSVISPDRLPPIKP